MRLKHLLAGLTALEVFIAAADIKPLNIPPSLYWDGDDGFWSTFHVQVGSPGQTVRLLPGTSASAGTSTWVVISQGCTDVNPTLPNCADERGYIFQSNLSTSWSTKGLQTGVDGAIYELNTFEEGKIGRSANGSYGFDTLSLGLPGSGLPTLERQVVAGIWTDDYFLGSLGLSPVPINFTNLNDPQPSMLGTLRNQSLIPSASWGYTAGAHYRNPPAYGSLTLGGYDASRFGSNNLSFAFGADFSRDLLVSLQAITYDTVGSSPLLANSIDIFINSMVSEIWLPASICEAFAKQFNLTWNTQGQLYLIDDAAHMALLAQNPTFTFQIGAAGGGGETVDIVLPYAAFDLNLTAPIVGDTTRYFPLKQAQDASQYTLGRSFLQEAYVVADYERHTFSVYQALFPATSVAQALIAIRPPSRASRHGGLSISAIVGIVLGILAVGIAGLVANWYFRRRSKEHKQRLVDPVAEEKRVESEHLELHGEDAMHEMDGQHPYKYELPAFRSGIGGHHELPSEDLVHELSNYEADDRSRHRI